MPRVRSSTLIPVNGFNTVPRICPNGCGREWEQLHTHGVTEAFNEWIAAMRLVQDRTSQLGHKKGETHDKIEQVTKALKTVGGPLAKRAVQLHKKAASAGLAEKERAEQMKVESSLKKLNRSLSKLGELAHKVFEKANQFGHTAAGIETLEYNKRWNLYRLRLTKDDIKSKGTVLKSNDD
jgi:hypothetical protein